MKRELLDILSDPNQGAGRFRAFAHELSRDGNILVGLDHEEIKYMDDIRTGFVMNEDNGYVYPISDYVLSFLSDDDVDSCFCLELLNEALCHCPSAYSKAIMDNIRRLNALNDNTASGKWNKEEMGYFDKAVDTEKKRKDFASQIRTKPLWHIFIERGKWGIEKLDLGSSLERKVLEIGCGNARTVAWSFSPSLYGYSYIGTDISFRRLVLAKNVVSAGDFVQSSALNLPFKKEVFCAAISFGVLHHLSDPLCGISCCISKIKRGGCLLLHEPIAKPSRLLDRRGIRPLRRLFRTYEHSAHDSVIDWTSMLEYFSKNNIRVINLMYSVSLVRTVVAFLMEKLSFIEGNKTVWRFLLAIDGAFIRLFCKKRNMLGPGAVLAIVQKEP